MPQTVYIRNHTVIVIQKIPGEGNCLLSTQVYQVYRENITQQEHKRRGIRKKAVNHIRKNIWKFRGSLKETVQQL